MEIVFSLKSLLLLSERQKFEWKYVKIDELFSQLKNSAIK